MRICIFNKLSGHARVVGPGCNVDGKDLNHRLSDPASSLRTENGPDAWVLTPEILI